MKGFEDRIVIKIDINVSGYKQYSLDAQLDTGAINSHVKHNVITKYYWQSTSLQFRVINKTLMTIKATTLDFPIFLH